MSEAVTARQWRTIAGVLGSLLLAVVVSGFFHFVHGGSFGCTVVTKDEWGFHDTVVDWSEIEQMSLFEVAGSGHAGVVRAMVRAGHLPELEERLRQLQDTADDLRRSADELRAIDHE